MRESSVLVVAVLALILSVVAVFFGLSGRRAATGLETRMSDAEAKLGVVQRDTSRVDDQVRSLFEQTQRALTALRTDIMALQGRFASPTNQAAVKPAGQPKDNKDSKDKAQQDEKKPGQGGATTPPQHSQAGTYKVKAGDTLANIAKQHKTSIEAIVKANPGIDPRKLKVGQSIKIP